MAPPCLAQSVGRLRFSSDCAILDKNTNLPHIRIRFYFCRIAPSRHRLGSRRCHFPLFLFLSVFSPAPRTFSPSKGEAKDWRFPGDTRETHHHSPADTRQVSEFTFMRTHLRQSLPEIVETRQRVSVQLRSLKLVTQSTKEDLPFPNFLAQS